MANTRINNDKDIITANLAEDVNISKYMLNAPGNGTTPYYIVDPYIRLQKFGANISSNIIDINSNLKGLDRTIGKHYKQKVYNRGNYSRNYYPQISSAITDQSRALLPPWQLRDLEQNNWDYVYYNPQNNSEIVFDNNISTRILEKDNYKPIFSNIN